MLRGGMLSTLALSLRRAATAFFMAVFLLQLAMPAYALSSGGIGGYPAHADPGIQYSDSWFIYNLDLGESKVDSVLLTNHSDTTQTLKLYPVDSVATGDGNFSLKAEADPRVGVGSWIQLSKDSVTLAPGEEQEVPFTITIPEVADVGEHSGGIILEKTQAGSAAIGQNSASIVTRVGIRVYETVPGELIRKVEPADFSVTRDVVTKNQQPTYRIQLSAINKSNVSIKAHATVHITGWGRTKYFPKSHFKDGFYLDYTDLYSMFSGDTLSGDWQLLRDQQVSTSWEWPVPAFGHYVFQADITYDGTNGPETFSTQPVEITVIPWMLLVWIAIIIILLIGLLVFKKMRMSGRGWQTYTVRSGEQLPDIAAAATISWKKLAAVNKIRAPYLVKAGQTIRVPSMRMAMKPVAEPTAEPSAEVKAMPQAAVVAPKKVVRRKITVTAEQPSAAAAPRKAVRRRAPAKKKQTGTTPKV